MEEIRENRIPFDLRENQSNKESIPFDIELTKEELDSFYDLINLGDLQLYGFLTSANSIFTLTIYAKGEVLLRDVHNSKECKYKIDDSVEVVLAPENPDIADITPDSDGIYDLRGSILALLYDCIPSNYSEVELETVETEDYILMSEDEYNRRKKNKSPFANVNLDD